MADDRACATRQPRNELLLERDGVLTQLCIRSLFSTESGRTASLVRPSHALHHRRRGMRWRCISCCRTHASGPATVVPPSTGLCPRRIGGGRLPGWRAASHGVVGRGPPLTAAQRWHAVATGYSAGRRGNAAEDGRGEDGHGAEGRAQEHREGAGHGQSGVGGCAQARPEAPGAGRRAFVEPLAAGPPTLATGGACRSSPREYVVGAPTDPVPRPRCAFSRCASGCCRTSHCSSPRSTSRAPPAPTPCSRHSRITASVAVPPHPSCRGAAGTNWRASGTLSPSPGGRWYLLPPSPCGWWSTLAVAQYHHGWFVRTASPMPIGIPPCVARASDANTEMPLRWNL